MCIIRNYNVNLVNYSMIVTQWLFMFSRYYYGLFLFSIYYALTVVTVPGVCMYVYMYVRMYVYVCMYVYMYVCMCVISMIVCIFENMY